MKTLAAAALLVSLATSAASQPLAVARIIDGDTIELSDGRTVRLIGIDAPEFHASGKLRRDAARTHRDRALIRALGKSSARHAARLALDKSVVLEFDQANAAIDHADRYGRTLAYVWVIDGNGSRRFCVNDRMVADGYAHAYTKYPFKRQERFRRLQRSARKSGIGLWSPDPDIGASLSTNRDRNCSDFATHLEAQRFFEQAGGPERDPHRLDGNGDGIVCEGLPPHSGR